MDPDARDLLRVASPTFFHVLPGVGRLVDAVAVARRCRGSAPRPSRRTRRSDPIGDGDRADRAGLEVLVGDELPVGAAVGRLPDAAARRRRSRRSAAAPGTPVTARDAAAAERARWPGIRGRSNWSERDCARASLASFVGAFDPSAELRGDRECQAEHERSEQGERRPKTTRGVHGAPFASGIGNRVRKYTGTMPRSLLTAGSLAVGDSAARGRPLPGRFRPRPEPPPLLPDAAPRDDAGGPGTRRRRARGRHRGRRPSLRLVDPGQRKEGAPLLPRQRRQHRGPSGAREDPELPVRARRFPRRLPRLRAIPGLAVRGGHLPRRPRGLRRRSVGRLSFGADRGFRRVPRRRRRGGSRPAMGMRGPGARGAVPVDSGRRAHSLSVRAGVASSGAASTTSRRSPT